MPIDEFAPEIAFAFASMSLSISERELFIDEMEEVFDCTSLSRLSRSEEICPTCEFTKESELLSEEMLLSCEETVWFSEES